MSPQKTVLIIDDDAEYRQILEKILQENGWKVLLASEGDEGIELAKRHRPEAVLCDLLMPRRNGFLVCRACHQIGPNAKNAVGPVLNGVVGRKAGTAPDFKYSDANRDSGIVWSPEELDKYLTDPQKVVPKTKMIFPGLKDKQKRADVIAYLEQFGPDGNKK